MASSEKVKFGMAHCENQETVILIFLKNVIKRFKVIPHKNSTKITLSSFRLVIWAREVIYNEALSGNRTERRMLTVFFDSLLMLDILQ